MGDETARQQAIVAALLEHFPTAFSQDACIELRNEPSPLFCLLCLVLLFSIRISTSVALNAARALFTLGWTTPEKIACSSWRERVEALDSAHYVRYDESKATQLGQMAEKILSDYQGDLRHLREKAQYHPDDERRLLMEFRGIGAVGASIFCREVQVVWNELLPFADEKALGPAQRLGLPGTPEGLRSLVPDSRFVNLVDALVKAGLNKAYDSILSQAKTR